jgi:hypothetical protein
MPRRHPRLQVGGLTLKKFGGDPPTPAAAQNVVYTRESDSKPVVKDAAGVEYDLTAAGGGTMDHAALTSNLAWTTSGHTSTADRLAGFTGAGAAEATTVSTGLTHTAGALAVAYGTSGTTACVGNDARLSDARTPTGAAGGDLAGTYASPTVTQARGLRETAGPTTLTMGAVADGQALFRTGSTVVGGYVGMPVVDIGTNYYPGCMTYSGILAAGGAMAANTYRATPWLCTRSGTIDRLAVDVTTAQAASAAEIAIWSDSSGAPGTVLAQGSVATTTTGVKTVTVSQAVTAGTVYWFTSLTNVANVALRTTSRTAGVYAAGGFALGGNNPMIIYQVAQAYASPTPAWPGGATWVDSGNNLPGVFYRLSA